MLTVVRNSRTCDLIYSVAALIIFEGHGNEHARVEIVCRGAVQDSPASCCVPFEGVNYVEKQRHKARCVQAIVFYLGAR